MSFLMILRIAVKALNRHTGDVPLLLEFARRAGGGHERLSVSVP